ncbi:calcium:proton antiporter, partial [Methylobacterium frigidaeris]
PDGSLTAFQAVAFSVLTVVLYGIFLLLQTGRHSDFFTDFVKPGAVAPEAAIAHPDAGRGAILRHAGLLLVSLLPIVLLSKSLAAILDHGIKALGAPSALGGVIIAAIVFTPEGISAIKAIRRDQLQRAINLCLGAVTSTVGLTVPAVLAIGLISGQRVVLGLAPAEMAVLAMTLLLSVITFSRQGTTVLEGAVHLVVFLTYLTLIFSP